MNCEIVQGDAIQLLKRLPETSVHCCITSPPYWGLRDYGVNGQIGLESTPEQYVDRLVAVFSEVRRVLRPDGTLWLNLGDSYATGAGKVGNCPGGGRQGTAWAKKGLATSPNRMPIAGLKPKDLVGVPWRVAFALQADGWYLRSDIIWHKPNVMPESVKDRPTKSHEYILLFSKSKNYFYDQDSIREPHSPSSMERIGRTMRRKKHKWKNGPGNQSIFNNPDGPELLNRKGRNNRTVWSVALSGFRGAHFATFPLKLVELCLLAGTPPGGIVLDPFCGSGTVGVTAELHHRRFLGFDLSPNYCAIARDRIAKEQVG